MTRKKITASTVLPVILSVGMCAGSVGVASTTVCTPTYAQTASSQASSPNSEQAVQNTPIHFNDENLKQAILKQLIADKKITPDVKEITLADASQLTYLDLHDVSNDADPINTIKDLTGLEYCTNLEDLTIRADKITHLTPLAKLKRLSTLVIFGHRTSLLTDLSPLKRLTNLTELCIDDCNELSNLQPLEKLCNLTTLHLENNKKLTDFSTLQNFTNLTDLSLLGSNISDLSPLANLTKLETMNATGSHITDLSPLANLTNMKVLCLSETQISSTSGLQNMTKLERLVITENKSLSDISSLANLTSLTSLGLYGNNISNITALQKLSNLKYLKLNGNSIVDITPLKNLKNLSEVKLDFQSFKMDIETDSVKLPVTQTEGLTFTLTKNPRGVASIKDDSTLQFNQISELPYKAEFEVTFNAPLTSINGRSLSSYSKPYSGTITINVNIPKEEPIKAKTRYKANPNLKYQETKTKTAAKDGTKKTYKYKQTVTEAAVDGEIEVGNKEVKSEDIEPGTTYVADASLAYNTTSETAGTKGTKTTTTIYKVDENKGLTKEVEGTPTVKTTPATDKIIKVGNVNKTTTEIGFKTIYVADVKLPFNTTQVKTAGKKGSKTTTTTYKVDKASGLTKDVENTEENTVPATDCVIHVGNKQVTDEGGKTATTTYDVDKDTGKLTNPKKHTHANDIEPAVRDTHEAEVLPAGMKYEADDTLPFNTQKKVQDAVDGLKITTHTGSYENGKWKPTTNVETTAAKDGLTKVGNKQVTHEGNKTITTTYDVDKDTGKLTNPKKHISMPAGIVIAPPPPSPSPLPQLNPLPKPNPAPKTPTPLAPAPQEPAPQPKHTHMPAHAPKAPAQRPTLAPIPQAAPTVAPLPAPISQAATRSLQHPRTHAMPKTADTHVFASLVSICGLSLAVLGLLCASMSGNRRKTPAHARITKRNNK